MFVFAIYGIETTAVPLITKKIVKKHVKQFKRTLSDWKIYVKLILYPEVLLDVLSMRIAYSMLIFVQAGTGPRVLISRVRRKFKVCVLMPNIDYGSDKKTRHYLPNGTYYAEIAHNVSTQKKKEIVERAAQLDIVITNKLARLRSQEDV
ncbi:60S ribosomal protein L32-1 [Camellia lanceoleosa]|uniref:60S ribosomal protein L32-1 n=1 Tax=Camellia lanceoleosa TaxID=1840588 RepID=A0ACC0G982_9ERIC|nr:60S ribosomal protein L32-1 [Camellia lanceoleosa]